MGQLDFLPVLLGSDVNVYGMARSFHEAYGIKSVAVGKGRLNATSNSSIVSVECVEPNLEDDAVFCKTLIDFAGRYPNKTLLVGTLWRQLYKAFGSKSGTIASLLSL